MKSNFEGVPGEDVSRLTPPDISEVQISRERLINHFSADTIKGLTVVLAPAGSGKTALLRLAFDNARATERRAVWLTLDEEDREPSRFLELFGHALRSARLLGATPASDGVARDRSARRIISSFASQLRHDTTPVCLFIDNFEHGESAGVNELLAAFLEQAPVHVSVVLASRTTPALPLGRLRAAGRLREIRTEELSFDEGEAIELLASANPSASEHSLRAISASLHGWAAGLRLAAVRLEQEAATATRKAGLFSLRDRSIAEYLESEVLSRMEPDVRRFLATVCHLTKLSGALCAAVTEMADAPALLERLARVHLLVTPLDTAEEWFQLHPVLAAFLQAIASRNSADEPRLIHRRASRWYANHNMMSDAVDHCVKAADFDELAELVDRCRYEIMMQGHVRRLESWLNVLPPRLLAERPHLRLTKCWILLWRRDWEQSQLLLEALERDISAGELDNLPLSDASRLQVRANTISLRYALAFFADDWDAICRIHAEDGEPQTPRGSPDSGVIYNIRTYCHYTMGKFDAARRSAAAARLIHEACGNTSGQVFLDSFVGLASYEQLQVDDALHHWSNAFELASMRTVSTGVVSSLPALLLAQLHYDRDELSQAHEYLDIAIRNTNEFSIFESIAVAARIRACLHSLDGDRKEALSVLGDAEAYGRAGKSDRLIAAALCSRLALLLRVGAESDAAELLEEIAQLKLRNAAKEQSGWPRIGLALSCAQARWFIATQEWKQAITLLMPLASAARKQAHKLTLVRVLILLAAATKGAGHADLAAGHLSEAIGLANPGRLDRIFLDDIALIRPVLEHAFANSEELKAKKLGFRDRDALLRFLERAHIDVPEQASADLTWADECEPLSYRERTVLSALCLGKTNRRIAESLGIAESTVAWHMKRILKKLWVVNRTEAIAKAMRLGIGAPT